MKKITGLVTRLSFKATRHVLKKCQYLLGSATVGARAIVINHDSHVLLVKHTYQPLWYLPGGGVNRNESAKAAIERELKEEVGIIVNEAPQLFSVYFHKYLGVSDYPVIYVVKNFEMQESSSLEIEEIGWFDFKALPESIAPGTKRRLNEYFLNTAQVDYW